METDKLPEHCFVFVAARKRGAIVKRGESGYYPTDLDIETEDEVRTLNDSLGISKAQEKAMLVGSMFGWDVPGANPDRYKDE